MTLWKTAIVWAIALYVLTPQLKINLMGTLLIGKPLYCRSASFLTATVAAFPKFVNAETVVAPLEKPAFSRFSRWLSERFPIAWFQLMAPHLRAIESVSTTRETIFPLPSAYALTNTSRKKLYDRIVIGGGATGCPLARTLADANLDVLLIERGGPRIDHPDTLDAYGTGIVVNNPSVAQLVITEEGVRSHTANVLSGGTAINMAILIHENDEYFEYLEREAGVKFNRTLLYQASAWTANLLGSEVVGGGPYGKRWTKFMESVIGTNIGSRFFIAVNHTWSGYSQFNSSNHWYRQGSDVALGRPGIDFPPKLRVLLQHVVHKIEFTFNSVTNNYRATCVIVKKTTPSDTAPIISERGRYSSYIAERAFEKRKGVYKAFVPPGIKYRICVKPDGEIISSAGALLTPVLLYKSGVGPALFVKQLGVPQVKELNALGSNLRDRSMFPIATFLRDPIPASGFLPEVGHNIGFGYVGTNCTNARIGMSQPGCSSVAIEGLSGAFIAEGVVHATRYPVPPFLRNDLFFDVLTKAAKDCSLTTPLRPATDAVCGILRPVLRCYHKSVSNFYFTTEPKSHGAVSIGKDGRVSVAANYLTDPDDVRAAIRGISIIIRFINTLKNDDLLERAGLDKCPMIILNGMLDLINKENTRRRSPEDAENPSQANDALYRWLIESRDAEAAYCRQQNMTLYDLTKNTNVLEERDFFNLSFLHVTTDKLATFPPTLPDADDEKKVLGLARSLVTSLWHWAGSAALGKVVNDQFLVSGFENLRIVDASVLTYLTRMNPTATLVSLGRYAGLLLTAATPPTAAA